MPYIVKEDRGPVYPAAKRPATKPGELNFQITVLINNYFKLSGNYQAINDVLGALEGAKLEFVRRVVNPYEDTKIIANGDIFNG